MYWYFVGWNLFLYKVTVKQVEFKQEKIRTDIKFAQQRLKDYRHRINLAKDENGMLLGDSRNILTIWKS
jgi:hypothetical protein